MANGGKFFGIGPAPLDYYALCFMRVWDQSEGFKSAEFYRVNVEKEVTRKRNPGDCFYFKRRKGMSFQAAERLNERRIANENMRRGFRYTQIALWIAAIGLVISAIVQMASCSSAG